MQSELVETTMHMHATEDGFILGNQFGYSSLKSQRNC
jgi:hypothetical protein